VDWRDSCLFLGVEIKHTMPTHSLRTFALGTFLTCLSISETVLAQGDQAVPASPQPSATPTTMPSNAAPSNAAPSNAAASLPPAVLEEAQRIYQMGQDAYSKGRYDSAFTSFHHAYQMTKAPDLLYNLAKVSTKLGQKEVAVGYYRQYLAGHPADEVTVQKELDDLQGPVVATAVSATASDPAAEPQIPRWVPWAMIGGGAGLLGISIGLLVAGGITPVDSSADQAQRRAMLASGGVLGGIGLAATVGGVVLRLRDKRSTAPKTAQLFLAPSGLGLQLAGTY